MMSAEKVRNLVDIRESSEMIFDNHLRGLINYLAKLTIGKHLKKPLSAQLIKPI